MSEKTWLQKRLECNKTQWDSLPKWLQDRLTREGKTRDAMMEANK